MSNKHLLLVPHCKKDGTWWWYEETRGIAIYYHAPKTDFHLDYFITWSALRKALARKDKEDKK